MSHNGMASIKYILLIYLLQWYNNILNDGSELVIKGAYGVDIWGSGIAGSNVHREVDIKLILYDGWYEGSLCEPKGI